MTGLIQPDALKGPEPWPWSPGAGEDVWAMFVACSQGDLAAVQRLVASDPSLVRAHYEYRTPLSFAVRENRLDVAEYLLDHGAAQVGLGDPVEMARDRGLDDMAALLERKYAELRGRSHAGEEIAARIRARDPEGVRALLDADPALVRARDLRSNEPIHWAVMTRQPDLVDELLARGADLDARRADGALPIHLCNGDYDYRGWRDVPADVTATPEQIYDHLVARGAAVDLGMAAFKGDEVRVRALLSADPSLANRPSPYNSYYVGCGAPLKNAAAGGHIGVVRLLLEHGADPNLPEEGIAPRGHALYAAVYHGHHDVAELLLERGAHPNPPVESSADAVWIALRRGDLRMLERLGRYGAVMDIPLPLDGDVGYEQLVATGVGLPPKILAYYGDADRLGARLAEDPARAHDPEALANAAGRGHADVVRLLLAHAPALATRVTVSSPREMPELLFAHGMDPHRPSWLRATPLHHFAHVGDVEGAALFLDHGADLEARDEEWRSRPLAFAARAGKARMVTFLLRRGASLVHDEDPPWATPLAWAERRGHADIVELLERWARTGKLPSRSLQEMASLARDLAGAYAGDAAALERIVRHFGLERTLTWDSPPLDVKVERLRRAVAERLAAMSGAPQAGDALDPDAARLLIARAEGFASWADAEAAGEAS